MKHRVDSWFLLPAIVLVAACSAREGSGSRGVTSEQGPTVALRTATPPRARTVLETAEPTAPAWERKIPSVTERPELDPARPFATQR
jgi:hypothetical protein